MIFMYAVNIYYLIRMNVSKQTCRNGWRIILMKQTRIQFQLRYVILNEFPL